jgi:hypothetical protein
MQSQIYIITTRKIRAVASSSKTSSKTSTHILHIQVSCATKNIFSPYTNGLPNCQNRCPVGSRIAGVSVYSQHGSMQLRRTRFGGTHRNNGTAHHWNYHGQSDSQSRFPRYDKCQLVEQGSNDGSHFSNSRNNWLYDILGLFVFSGCSRMQMCRGKWAICVIRSSHLLYIFVYRNLCIVVFEVISMTCVYAENKACQET